MVIYIKEGKKHGVLQKVNSILNKVEIIYNDNKIICEIPSNKKNYSHIINKIMKKLNINKINAAVLSNNLLANENIREILETKNIYILNGKFVKNIMLCEALEKIATCIGKRIEELEVSILINAKTDFFIQNIQLIASKVKTLNIITNNIGSFKSIESNLYDNGILIRVINNKKRSLLRSDAIINVDFSEELMNLYNFKSSSVFFNVNNNAIIKKKSFNGINIRDINIEMKSTNLLNDFNSLLIYESICFEMQFNNIRKKIENDRLFVKEFIGINGILSESEFKNLI